jgi:hypothetical protein
MNRARQVFPIMGVMLGVAFGSASASNAVTDWHANMESAVVATGKKSPTVAFVYFAYADVAMYDAVNSIDRRFQPFAVQVYAPRSASKDAAASVAAHDVLVHYLPLQRKRWVSHDFPDTGLRSARDEVVRSELLLQLQHTGKTSGLGIESCRRTAPKPALVRGDQAVRKPTSTVFPVEQGLFQHRLVVKRQLPSLQHAPKDGVDARAIEPIAAP